MRNKVLYRGITFRQSRKDGYLEARLALHRLVWTIERGAIPPGHHIHHKNHNNLDNRIENLECLPASEHVHYHFAKRADLKGKQREWANSDSGRKILSKNMEKARRNTALR